MDHPQGYDRPQNYKSETEKKQRAAEQAERRLKLTFDSHVHDFQKLLSREKAENLAAAITGYKPK